MDNILKIAQTLNSVKDTKDKGTETSLIEGTLYIKGSDDLSDWVINFSTIDRELHTGFLIESTTIYMKYRKSNVLRVVGHSAGGAIACLVGMAFNVPVITLGSPRLYKKSKASKIHDFCSKMCTNYRLRRDPVCFFPFWYNKIAGKQKTLPNDRVLGHFLEDYLRNLSKG